MDDGLKPAQPKEEAESSEEPNGHTKAVAGTHRGDKTHWTGPAGFVLALAAFLFTATMGIINFNFNASTQARVYSLQTHVAQISETSAALTRSMVQADEPLRLSISGAGDQLIIRNTARIQATSVRITWTRYVFSTSCGGTITSGVTMGLPTRPWKELPQIQPYSQEQFPVMLPLSEFRADDAFYACGTSSQGIAFLTPVAGPEGKSLPKMCSQERPCRSAIRVVVEGTHPKTYAVARFIQYFKLDMEGSTGLSESTSLGTLDLATNRMVWREHDDELLFQAVARQVKAEDEAQDDRSGLRFQDMTMAFYDKGIWWATGVAAPALPDGGVLP